eukprot:scaffold164738_cov21-Tisochrysis_lutea.AAC.2
MRMRYLRKCDTGRTHQVRQTKRHRACTHPAAHIWFPCLQHLHTYQVGLSAIELVRIMWALRKLFGSRPLSATLADDLAGAALALVPGYHELDPPSLMYLARGLAGLGST